MFRRVIEVICAWYVEKFGTATAFAISLVGLVLWLLPIPLIGFWQWNNTFGLLGNSAESTGEWFFGVATLVVAGNINRRQQEHQDQLAQAVSRVEESDRRIEQLEQTIAQQGEEILSLLRELGQPR